MDATDFLRIKNYFPVVKFRRKLTTKKKKKTNLTLFHKILGNIKDERCVFNNAFKGMGIRLVSNIIPKITIL